MAEPGPADPGDPAQADLPALLGGNRAWRLAALILNGVAQAGAAFGTTLLRDVMTPSPLTASADDGILAAAQLMGERNLRHLPVVEGGNLVGIVSIRDVLGFLAERLWAEKDEAAHDTARALLDRR